MWQCFELCAKVGYFKGSLKLNEIHRGPKVYKHEIFMSYVDKLRHLNKNVKLIKKYIDNFIFVAICHN
jgi:hypothetical protein